MNVQNKVSFMYSERGQRIMDELEQTGLFPNKLSILQLATIVGLVHNKHANDYKAYKMYDTTRVDEGEGLRTVVETLGYWKGTAESPLHLLETYADWGLIWLVERLREPDGVSFVDLIGELQETCEESWGKPTSR